MPGEAAGFQQISRCVEVHLGTELEVLLGAAGHERRQMEYDLHFGCDERAGEAWVGEVADHLGRRRLVGGNDFGSVQSID